MVSPPFTVPTCRHRLFQGFWHNPLWCPLRELVTVEWRFLLKCLLLALRIMLVQCLTISSQ